MNNPQKHLRPCLVQMMSYEDGKLLNMVASGCGDVRAPLSWFVEEDKIMKELGFVSHPFDKCLYLSCKSEVLPISAEEGLELFGGVMGLHVDDYVGGG